MKMRAIITLIEGFSSPHVPFDAWGYWVLPDGHVEDVTDHAEYAQSEFSSEDDRPIDLALDAGWIRVFCPIEGNTRPKFSATWGKRVPKANAALKTLIKDLPDFDAYEINGKLCATKAQALATTSAREPRLSSVEQHWLDSGGDPEALRKG
jgi:hypothetical protein